jgi:hypothetical protein
MLRVVRPRTPLRRGKMPVRFATALSLVACTPSTVLGLSPPAASTGYRITSVRRDWTFLSDYVFTAATWTLNAEEGCNVEVGTGVFVAGRPRGTRKVISRRGTFFTLGFGSIHARTLPPGQATCSVRLDQGDVGLVPILSDRTSSP